MGLGSLGVHGAVLDTNSGSGSGSGSGWDNGNGNGNGTGGPHRQEPRVIVALGSLGQDTSTTPTGSSTQTGTTSSRGQGSSFVSRATPSGAAGSTADYRSYSGELRAGTSESAGLVLEQGSATGSDAIARRGSSGLRGYDDRVRDSATPPGPSSGDSVPTGSTAQSPSSRSFAMSHLGQSIRSLGGL